MLSTNNRSQVLWDIFLFAVLFGLYFLALFVRPSRNRRIIFVPIAGLVLYLMASTRTAGSPPVRGSTIAAVNMPVLFAASDFIFLTEVQRDLRRKGQRVRAERMKWRERFVWAFSLFSSPRGIGWEHEPSHAIVRALPRWATQSRWTFVKAQIIKLAVYSAALDLLRWHDRWNPCYARNGPSITAFGWTWRGFSMLSWGIQTYIQIDRLYWIMGTVSVLAKLTSPGEWPLFFGDVRDGYTVRRFWGRTWHQLLRRPLTSHARYVAHNLLGLKRGTQTAALIQLWIAFLISGLIHSGIDYSLYGRATFNLWARSGYGGGGGGALSFFLRQPVAIIFEDVAVRFANKAFPNVVGSRSSSRQWWWRVLGYLWVLTWFTYCMPMWLDPLIRSGMVESNSGPWIDRRSLVPWLS